MSGEYLSAASFLGIAGLVVKDGIGALWYPVGFTAGYVAMLALVAAPMRRTGALTVPDFAEARLGSRSLRTLSAVVVLVIATLYLVPQFKAAGAGADRGERHAVLGGRRGRGRGGRASRWRRPAPAAPVEDTPLERRRAELAERVAELQFDLGGLAYEMAIRDHFRLDVLLRRAAELQQADGELGRSIACCGWSAGQAMAIVLTVHNTPFGDIVDTEDDLQPLV